MTKDSPLRSAAFRFALAFASVFAVAALLLLGMVRHQVGRYAREATRGSLATETAVLAAEDRSMLARGIERRMRATPDGNFTYLLLDPQGRKLIGTIPTAAAHPGWGSVVMRERRPAPDDPEHPERLVTLGTRLDDGSLLLVATDGFDVVRLGGHMMSFTIIWATAITLAALAAGWWTGRLFLTRLAAVNAAVERVMTGRLDQRLPAIGLAPELDDLSRNLNRMLDRIGGLMDGLRQVSTDVAHDLRTPLTRLRQQLEAAREASADEQASAGIDAAIAQTDQLLATFRAMLRLAQIEGGGRRTPLMPIDLGALLCGLVDTYEPVAADAGHSLVAPVGGEMMVIGDGDLLAQLFANLIENAILHTPAGTRVAITMERGASGVVASVSDDGPGVPEAERSRITRRFYQLEPSRSSGSAGLGLAVVSAIVQLHGATLSIDDARPGLRVSVRFAEAGPASV
ncbi:sensor histidine kinase [Sphingomonas sp.]|uniref:sensor histidine kinase n=1 Tax=Sphingomonas sp. TaxID=28214 RepID=UPI003AFFE783